jgi:hypothetical protein
MKDLYVCDRQRPRTGGCEHEWCVHGISGKEERTVMPPSLRLRSKDMYPDGPRRILFSSVLCCVCFCNTSRALRRLSTPGRSPTLNLRELDRRLEDGTAGLAGLGGRETEPLALGGGREVDGASERLEDVGDPVGVSFGTTDGGGEIWAVYSRIRVTANMPSNHTDCDFPPAQLTWWA